jgi:hypothetical protein
MISAESLPLSHALAGKSSEGEALAFARAERYAAFSTIEDDVSECVVAIKMLDPL